MESLEEKFRIKVDSKGNKTRKIKCRSGFMAKTDSNGTQKCVPIPASQKIKRRKAAIKGAKTKKAKGSGFQNRVNRKTEKAKRKRKGLGV